jgi:hypothetical protein
MNTFTKEKVSLFRMGMLKRYWQDIHFRTMPSKD